MVCIDLRTTTVTLAFECAAMINVNERLPLPRMVAAPFFGRTGTSGSATIGVARTTWRLNKVLNGDVPKNRPTPAKSGHEERVAGGGWRVKGRNSREADKSGHFRTIDEFVAAFARTRVTGCVPRSGERSYGTKR
jgi:hypothetical protein